MMSALKEGQRELDTVAVQGSCGGGGMLCHVFGNSPEERNGCHASELRCSSIFAIHQTFI